MLLTWLEGDVARLRAFAAILEASIADPAWRRETVVRDLAYGCQTIGLRLEALLSALGVVDPAEAA